MENYRGALCLFQASAANGQEETHTEQLQPSSSAAVLSACSRSLSLISSFCSQKGMCALFCVVFVSFFPPAPLYYIYYAWLLYYMLIYTKRKKKQKQETPEWNTWL